MFGSSTLPRAFAAVVTAVSDAVPIEMFRPPLKGTFNWQVNSLLQAIQPQTNGAKLALVQRSNP
jgi:hypothetical protein